MDTPFLKSDIPTKGDLLLFGKKSEVRLLLTFVGVSRAGFGFLNHMEKTDTRANERGGAWCICAGVLLFCKGHAR